MPRTVKVELTVPQAEALFSLADAQTQSNEDAESVLATPGSRRAGYAAIDKLRVALWGEGDEHEAV